MKNRLVFSLLSAALIALPTLSRADPAQVSQLLVYKLANGQGVMVALPGGWQEVSKKRVLEPGSPARFLDESGRAVKIPAADLEHASKTRSVVWSKAYGETSVAAQ